MRVDSLVICVVMTHDQMNYWVQSSLSTAAWEPGPLRKIVRFSPCSSNALQALGASSLNCQPETGTFRLRHLSDTCQTLAQLAQPTPVAMFPYPISTKPDIGNLPSDVHPGNPNVCFKTSWVESKCFKRNIKTGSKKLKSKEKLRRHCEGKVRSLVSELCPFGPGVAKFILYEAFVWRD